MTRLSRLRSHEYRRGVGDLISAHLASAPEVHRSSQRTTPHPAWRERTCSQGSLKPERFTCSPMSRGGASSPPGSGISTGNL
jgi:hypothetical protein